MSEAEGIMPDRRDVVSLPFGVNPFMADVSDHGMG